MCQVLIVRLLNIPGLSICQGSEFSRVHLGLPIFKGTLGFNYYDRVLNMHQDAIKEGI